jgi:hypothetical protein
VFYFDGASNVQKVGQILMAKFLLTFCFHGGEHVVSLSFLLDMNLSQSNTHLVYLSGFDSQNVHDV